MHDDEGSVFYEQKEQCKGNVQKKEKTHILKEKGKCYESLF